MDIDKKPLQWDIYNKIKRAILIGEYKMGQQLTETSLSQSYGVSRIPVRGALAMLVSEGLVISIPYRGHFVRPLTDADVKEIYQFRYAIESFSATIVVDSMPETVVQELAMHHHQYGSSTNAPIEEVAQRDLEFHQVPIRATKNSRLIRAWELLQDEIMRLLCLASHPQTNDIKQVTEEHQRIFEGYQKKDIFMIHTALKEHFSHAEQRTIRQLLAK